MLLALFHLDCCSTGDSPSRTVDSHLNVDQVIRARRPKNLVMDQHHILIALISFHMFQFILTVFLSAGPFEAPPAGRPGFPLLASHTTSTPQSLFIRPQLSTEMSALHRFTSQLLCSSRVSPTSLKRRACSCECATTDLFWNDSLQTRESLFLGNVNEEEDSAKHPVLLQLWR